MTIDRNNLVQQLVMLLIVFILCNLVGSLLAEGVMRMQGLSLMASDTTFESYSASQRVWQKVAIMITHFSAFIGASLIFGWLYHNEGRGQQSLMRLIRPTEHLGAILLWIVIILVAYPAVGYLTLINEALPLPSWASSGQEANLALLSSVLKMETPIELILTIFLVAVLPAIGEELLFRGIIQNKLVSIFNNPHVAIALTALAFGLVHGQLGRLLPLSFLGLLLGYSYYISKNFWVPVILHFLNNGIQVLLVYAAGDVSEEMISQAPEIHPLVGLGSIIVTFALVYFSSRHVSIQNESRP